MFRAIVENNIPLINNYLGEKMKKSIFSLAVLLIILNIAYCFSESKRDYYPKKIRIDKVNKTIYTKDWGKTWNLVCNDNIKENDNYQKPKRILIKRPNGNLYRSTDYGETWTMVNRKHYKNTNSFMNIYPNPSSGYVKVDFAIDNIETVRVQLYNITGRLIRRKKIKKIVIGVNAINLNIRDLEAGNYIIKVNGNSINLTGKFALIK